MYLHLRDFGVPDESSQHIINSELEIDMVTDVKLVFISIEELKFKIHDVTYPTLFKSTFHAL